MLTLLLKWANNCFKIPQTSKVQLLSLVIGKAVNRIGNGCKNGQRTASCVCKICAITMLVYDVLACMHA